LAYPYPGLGHKKVTHVQLLGCPTIAYCVHVYTRASLIYSSNPNPDSSNRMSYNSAVFQRHDSYSVLTYNVLYKSKYEVLHVTTSYSVC